MREIVFDTETTGLDPATGDRMVEIGCVEMINRIPSGTTFHAYFNPERDMPPQAEAVHGLSNAFLAGKPLFAEQADELIDFLGDVPLIAHNAGFDLAFLNSELTLIGRESVDMERVVDTVAIARKRIPGAKVSLDALCKRYGIDRSHRVKHGALLDAELLAQVYIELMGGRQIGLDLAVRTTSETRAEPVRTSAPSRPRREPRPHAASVEELARHGEFVDRMRKPIWSK